MGGFILFIRGLLRKRSHRSTLHRAIFSAVLLTPVLTILTLILCFFWFDDFNFYATLLWKSEGGVEITADNYVGLPTDWETDPSGGTGGSSGTLVPGEIGLRAMYINKMQGSYYKEFLEIVRDHCNWNYMPDEISPVTLKSGETLYPTIFSILGTGLAETGLERPNRIAPHTIMMSTYWKPLGEFSLKQFNSSVVRAHGAGTLANGMPLTLKWGGYYTPYQFSHGMAAVYPDRDYAPTSSTAYPSKLNGFGFSASDKRTRAQTDAAYFPDVVALTIQKTYGLLKGWADFDTLSPDGLTASMYPVFNAGIGGPGNMWAMGTKAGSDYWWAPENTKFRRGAWGSANTVSKAEVVSGGINLITDLANKCLAKIDEASSGTQFNFANQSDYEGMATVALLMNGGFLGTEHARLALSERMTSAGFQRGALVAYRVFSDDMSATLSDVLGYLKKQSVKSIDTSFYGAAVHGKTAAAVGYNEIVVHVYDENYKVYNSDNQGPRTLLRAYNLESARGSFMSVIGGPWVYKNMLQAAGVEVTLQDALKDGLAAKVETAPGSQTGSSSAPEGASYYNGGIPFSSFVPGSSELSKLTSAMYWRNLDISTGVHYGEDYRATVGGGQGVDLAAIADGTVVDVGMMNGRGNFVVIQMDSLPGEPKFQYLYQHLTKSYVKKGQRVRAGDVIAMSGGTGGDRKFAVHLHLEIFVWRGNTNQKYCLPFKTLFDGKATAENCPAVIGGYKSAPGYVYDKNLKQLGSLREIGDRSNQGYYVQGANAYLDAALRAP